MNSIQSHPASGRILRAISLSLLLITVAALSTAQAQRSFGIGLNAGTTGLGAELATNLNQNFTLRAGMGTGAYSINEVIDDNEPAMDVNADLSLNTFSFMIDYFPMKRGLKLTAGFIYHDFDVTADVIPNEPYTLNAGQSNEKVFAPERLGSLTIGLVYPNKFQPYVGLGFGNMVGRGFPLKLSMNLGLMYSGAPELTMTGTGMIAPTADHAPNIQEGLEVFEWFPVFNLGLSYRIR
jgi:hypothetical protein